MKNAGFLSSLHVFDLPIRHLLKPRNFTGVTAEFSSVNSAVPRGIYEINRGICQILPRKTVGPTDHGIRTFPHTFPPYE